MQDNIYKKEFLLQRVYLCSTVYEQKNPFCLEKVFSYIYLMRGFLALNENYLKPGLDIPFAMNICRITSSYFCYFVGNFQNKRKTHVA